MHENPKANVKFSTLVEERSLDVLLHNPLGVLGLLMHEIDNIPNLTENLNASALVSGGWFKDPLVFATMLFWDTFFL